MSRKSMIYLLLITAAVINICGIEGIHVKAEGAEGKPLRDVFKQVDPAVVVIVTGGKNYLRSIQDFSINTGSLGSGIIISKDGLIMTAGHLVEDVDEVSVFFLDGDRARAKVINTAKQADVALLRLKEIPYGIQAVEMGDSDTVQTGDEIFVVGSPYGIDHTLTVGHISGRRQLPALCQLTPIEFLQTDAGINMGSSGGPLFSMDGKVIGIVSRILSRSGGSEGLGFAVSIKTAKALLFDQDTFWSGMETYLVSGELAKALNLPQEAGLLVQKIATGSIAQKAGIREGTLPVQIGNHKIVIGGDVLLEVQGIMISPDINDTCRIREDMDKEEEKDIIRIKILRNGKILDLKARETGRVEGE